MSEEAQEDGAFAEIVADIAMLARKLAEAEPYKSACGSDALRALAAHLEGMITRDGVRPLGVIRVAVRKKKNR